MADDSSDMSVALTAAESAHSLSSDSSEDLGGEQDLGGDPTMMEDEGGVEVEEGHGYVPKSIPGRREKRRLGLRRRERKISVHSDHVKIKMETIKEGFLLQQGRTFQRWGKRYVVIKGDRVFIAKNQQDKLREEVALKAANIAENSAKNVNHSFTILTPIQHMVFAATDRKELEDWISAFKSAASKTGDMEALHHLEGLHSWFSCTHARPTYCNVCREMLHGVAWHGLSCEVCKFKCHRRCVFGVEQACKWTTRSSLERDGGKVEADFSITHQWMEGNIPTGSKCAVCEKACGSVRRLQDFRCMWCKWTVHAECMDQTDKVCSLGEHALSILPPSALQRSDAIKKGMWEPYKVFGHSPLLALVNSKSGDNQGVKFLRRLKFWLNPVQVFDLACSGPDLGLKLFQRFEKFRVIVFGGDGSVGWVLSAVDKYNLHSKCMLGVVPLGTGNDMARVMGWGALFNDEEKLPFLLREMEQSSFRLLDRWSLQLTQDRDIDMTALFGALSPIKSAASTPTSKPGPTPPTSVPFPGPGTSSNQLSVAVSPDSVFSPQGSASSISDSDCRSSAASRSPSPPSPGLTFRPCSLETGKKEGGVKRNNRFSGCVEETAKVEAFHGSLAAHLSTILLSEDGTKVVSSAQVLCEVVQDFTQSVVEGKQQLLPPVDFPNDPLVQRCTVLQDKLNGLLFTLRKETAAASQAAEEGEEERVFKARDALSARADSLKKAVKGVLDMTEKVVDSQAHTTAEIEALTRTSRNGISEDPAQFPLGHAQFPRPRKTESVSSSCSVVEPAPLIPEMKEVAVINNYFGIGLDAKITYQFNHTREKNPAQYKSRAKNKLLYGCIGGKEFFVNSQRYLERRILLECDGVTMALPSRLQGLVFLNIPSYMAGTNFWGTDKEKEGFLAPSHDDKLLEVVGITGFTHLATSKVLGIQKQRIAQCRCAKVVLLGPETLPVQVDGEAWLQEPGTIVISHKNKARMMFKDKAFAQSLESWKQKNIPSSHSTPTLLGTGPNTSPLCEVLSAEELQHYREVATSVRPLVEHIQAESGVSTEVARDLAPLASQVTNSLERVLPDNQLSQTADVEHLQDLERDVKALLQEVLWFLNMCKISSERKHCLKACVRRVEERMRRLSHEEEELSTASLSLRGFRRASDTTLLAPEQPQHDYTSAGTPLALSRSPHRERTALLVPDATINAAAIARKIGKDVDLWDSDDVCQWLRELGLGEHTPSFVEDAIGGKELLELQKADFEALGVVKVSHQTRLRQALKALFPAEDEHVSVRRTRDTVV